MEATLSRSGKFFGPIILLLILAAIAAVMLTTMQSTQTIPKQVTLPSELTLISEGGEIQVLQAQKYTGGVGFQLGKSRLVLYWTQDPDGGCWYEGEFLSNNKIQFTFPRIYTSVFCNSKNAQDVLDEFVRLVEASGVLRSFEELEKLHHTTLNWFQNLR